MEAKMNLKNKKIIGDESVEVRKRKNCFF